MRPAELTTKDVALFARLVVDPDDYAQLSAGETMACEMALQAAKAFAAGYTGLDIDTTELEDVAYAVLTIAAEMVDNHQMTAQYTGRNPTAMQILDMHSTNLLPEAVDAGAT